MYIDSFSNIFTNRLYINSNGGIINTNNDKGNITSQSISKPDGSKNDFIYNKAILTNP